MPRSPPRCQNAPRSQVTNGFPYALGPTEVNRPLTVTAVVLGGVDIFGGRGRVVGVLLALILLGTLRNGMGLANFPGPVQTLIVGLLLVVSVLVSQSVLGLGAWIGANRIRRQSSVGTVWEDEK